MKKKHRGTKILISLVIVILIISFGGFFTYKTYFAPTVPVTSLNTEITVNPLEFALKLIPNNVDFSLKDIKLTSNVTFTESDLTNFTILAIQQNSNLKNKIEGLQYIINDNKINLYVNFKYAGIPLEAHLIFSSFAKNGQAAIHYESGNVGFVKIPSKLLFKYINSNDFITVDKGNNDIYLKFKNASNISINKFNINNNKLDIDIESNIKLLP